VGARALAARLAQTHVGVIAWSRTGNPDLGDWGPPEVLVLVLFLNLLSIEDQLQKILFHRRCNKGADQFTNAHAPELSLER